MDLTEILYLAKDMDLTEILYLAKDKKIFLFQCNQNIIIIL